MSWFTRRDPTVSTPTANAESMAGYDVFLLIGQSNMVGYAYNDPVSPLDYVSPRIYQLGQFANLACVDRVIVATDPLQHTGGGLSCTALGTHFARLYENNSLEPGRRILLVPSAHGATGFSGPNSGDTSDTALMTDGQTLYTNWLAGRPGNLLDHAIRRANKAMAYHPILNPLPAYDGSNPPAANPLNEFKGVLWHQGETDITNNVSEASYKASLQALITEVRSKVNGASNATVFIAGLLTPAWTARYPTAGPNRVLRQIANLAYFGVTNVGLASSIAPSPAGMDLRLGGDHHFSAKGLREMGRRYYEQYVYLTEPVSNVSLATASVAANGNMIVSWSPPSSVSLVTAIDLYAGSNLVKTFYLQGGALNIPASLLAPNTSYNVMLTMRSAKGASSQSVAVSTSTGPLSVPAISNLTAAVSPTSNATALSWTNGPGVSNVTISYASSGKDYTTYATTTANNITLPGVLLANTTYAIRAEPRGLTGNGGASFVAVTTLAPVAANALVLYVKATSSDFPESDALGKTLSPFTGSTGVPNSTGVGIYKDTARGHVLNFSGGWVDTQVALPASYTKAAWVYATSAVTGASMVVIGSTNGSPNAHSLSLMGNGVAAGHGGTSLTYQATDSTAFPLNSWVHLATTYDATSNAMVLYRNGVAVSANASATVKWTGTGYLSIGCFGDVSSVKWQGYMDDVRVYSAALVPSQVRQLYSGSNIAASVYNVTAAGNAANVQVSWSATLTPNVQVSYGIGASPGSFTVVGNTTATSIQVSGLLSNTLYTIRVVPFDVLTPGTAVTTQVTTNDVWIAAPVLSGLSAAPGATLSDGVSVTWTSANTSTVNLAYGIGASPGTFTAYGSAASSPVVMANVFVAATMYTIQATPNGLNGAGTAVTTTFTTPTLIANANAVLYLKPSSMAVPTTDQTSNAITLMGSQVSVVHDVSRGYVLNMFGGWFNTTVGLPASYTKSAWVNLTGPVSGASRCILSSVNGSPNAHTLGVTSAVGNVLQAGHGPNTGGGIQYAVTDSIPFPSNTWVHVATTYNSVSNTMVLYRGGVEVASNSSAAKWGATGGNLAIGSFSGLASIAWAGYLDDLRVYNTALTPEQILQISG